MQTTTKECAQQNGSCCSGASKSKDDQPKTNSSCCRSNNSSPDKIASVQEYYGKVLKGTDCLKTSACCDASAPPPHIRECIKNIHPSVLEKFYGCGLCLPQYDLTGMKVLDLGSGSGRDVYIASQLVGPTGKVVGVDMTPEQLETARGAQEYHKDKMGYDNVEILCGYLEKLDEIPELNDQRFDVIISNCVINLCSDKQAVLKHCYSLLKEGGELYFSDVYANCRVPKSLQDDPVLWGECISGALYWNDFIHMARNTGFADPRLVEDRRIELNSKPIQQMFADQGYADSKFYSATYRLWKLPDLEPASEDYGQAVVYKGTIPRYRSGWLLDKHRYFEQGKVKAVCGNTWRMLKETCLSNHFDFIGSFDRHFGRFMDCGSGGLGTSFDGTNTTITTTV